VHKILPVQTLSRHTFRPGTFRIEAKASTLVSVARLSVPVRQLVYISETDSLTAVTLCRWVCGLIPFKGMWRLNVPRTTSYVTTKPLKDEGTEIFRNGGSPYTSYAREPLFFYSICYYGSVRSTDIKAILSWQFTVLSAAH